MDVRDLWQHQKEGVAYALPRDYFAWFYEQGAGKTPTCITTLRHKYAEVGHLRKTLILTPIITLKNWKDEFKEWSKINQSDVVILRGTGKQKLRQFVNEVTDAKGLMTRNRIIIANYEVVQNDELLAALIGWAPEILICDEAQRLKNHKGKRSRRVVTIADRTKIKYILTGTPILNDAQDIFQLYRIMDGGRTFGTNFYAFRNRYFMDLNAAHSHRQGHYPDWCERPEMNDELTRKIYYDAEGKVQAHRKLKKDCLDLPPMVTVPIDVELSSNQRKMYDEMRKHFMTFVKEKQAEGQPMAVIANMAVTKVLRMQQIVTGFVKAEDGKEYPIEDNPRLDALKELLQDTDEKVIVWACFKQNYKDIGKVCEELGLEHRYIHGDMDVIEKEKSIADFRKDPKVRVMIANQKAAGIGVNLIEAPISIVYSRNFSREDDEQSKDRNYRGGSEMHEKITRYILRCAGTTDDVITESLLGKRKIADILLDLVA